MGKAKEVGQAWPWCPVRFVDGPPVSFKAGGEAPEGVRFRNMAPDQILEAAQAGVPDSETPALLTAGFLKGLLNASGEARLVVLLDRREAARLALQAERRERVMYGGRTLAEIQEGGNDAA